MQVPTFRQYAKSRYLESDCRKELFQAEYMRALGSMLESQYFEHACHLIEKKNALIHYRIARKLFRHGVAEIYYRQNGQFWTGKKLFCELWGQS
jgi:hypothetical protein